MTVKKRTLLKMIRLPIMILVAILLIASLSACYYLYRLPPTVEEKSPAYNYDHKGELSCRVPVKPNMVIKKEAFGPKETIYPNIAESFSVIYSYRYNGDKPAQIKGTYSLTAKLEAKDMWSLDFTLVPQTPFNSSGQTFNFNSAYPLDLAYFQNILKQVNEQLGINGRETNIIIKENINVEAVTPDGLVKESLAPTMTVPLSAGTYKVDGDLTAEKSGVIEKTILLPNPSRENILFAIILAVTTALALAFLVFLTSNKTVVFDPYEQEKKSIQQKYGERMVTIGAGLNLPHVIPLTSMDNLVKLADELGRPIIKEEPNDIEMQRYCVIDSSTAYVYILDKNKIMDMSPVSYTGSNKALGI